MRIQRILFNESFKTYTGYSCIDYANNYRLWKSEQLLAETNCAVGKIAREVGFDNASYFNRKFLDLYGVTPSNYRALYFDNRRKNSILKSFDIAYKTDIVL